MGRPGSEGAAVSKNVDSTSKMGPHVLGTVINVGAGEGPGVFLHFPLTFFFFYSVGYCSQFSCSWGILFLLFREFSRKAQLLKSGDFFFKGSGTDVQRIFFLACGQTKISLSLVQPSLTPKKGGPFFLVGKKRGTQADSLGAGGLFVLLKKTPARLQKRAFLGPKVVGAFAFGAWGWIRVIWKNPFLSGKKPSL